MSSTLFTTTIPDGRPYEQLAHAVILAAVEDYVWACQRSFAFPEDRNAYSLEKECERFFYSPAYKRLTHLDGRDLLQRIWDEIIAQEHVG